MGRAARQRRKRKIIKGFQEQDQEFSQAFEKQIDKIQEQEGLTDQETVIYTDLIGVKYIRKGLGLKEMTMEEQKKRVVQCCREMGITLKEVRTEVILILVNQYKCVKAPHQDSFDVMSNLR